MPDHSTSATPAVTTVARPVEADVYLTECASCGGQFPSFRAICAECEDVADVDGYRDGRKLLGPPLSFEGELLTKV